MAVSGNKCMFTRRGVEMCHALTTGFDGIRCRKKDIILMFQKSDEKLIGGYT